MSSNRERAARAFIALAAVAIGALPAAGRAEETPAFEESALEFVVNSESAGTVLLALRDGDGGLWLSEDELGALRLATPDGASRMQAGVRYYPLAGIEGLVVTLDETQQRAVLEAPAGAFTSTRLSLRGTTTPSVNQASPGAFLNYQLSAQHVERNIGGALAELGVFGGPGVITSTAVARYDVDSSHVVRLDTTFTRDLPESLRTLTFGDAISDPGSYGNSVRFGGLHFSRNYGLRPDLLTMPMLSTSGTATVPSTVDVFVNNQLVSRQSLPPGPFVIDRLPAVSGSGEISVVVRDLLGREQVTTRSFYASSSLLAHGLTQYSVDIGSLRRNYALASSDYGQFMAAGTYRKGVTDALTLEGRAELSGENMRNAGLNVAAGVGDLGVLNLTIAAGGDAIGHGWLRGVGFEHRGRRASLIANFSRATPAYRQIGDSDTPDARIRGRALLQSGVSFDRGGSLAVAYVRESFLSQPSQQTLSLSHSLRVGQLGMLSATILRQLGAQHSTAGFLMFTTSLDLRRSVSLTGIANSDSSGTQSQVIGTLMQNTAAGPSSGYRASASSAGDFDLAWDRRFESTDVQLQAARFGGTQGQSAYVSGAATWLDGELRASRSVTGSFAVIDLGTVTDVPVYLEHQPVGRTNANGRLILSDLRPYEANRVGIRAQDLPLDTDIGAPEITIVPPYRSGVVARFPVTRIRHGTFRLVRRDGQPVPVGATVNFNGHRFPVVLDGFVYVTNFDHGLSATAQWPGGRCRFRIPPPPAGEPMPDMGSLTCRDAPLSVDARPNAPTQGD
jgi:outer membrane usher protein